MIAGVCGGLADWLDWSPTMVRIAYVLLSILSAGFPGILVYLVLWVVMPKAPRRFSYSTNSGTTSNLSTSTSP